MGNNLREKCVAIARKNMKNHPDDKLYNRRLMAYSGLFFSVVWFVSCFCAIVVLAYTGKSLEPATAASLLTVPAALAGLGFWGYLGAAKKDDEK